MESSERLEENEQCNFATTLLFHEVCRACLTSNEIVSIFEVSYSDISLRDILKCCLNVEISPDDGLPKGICEPCIATIIQVYVFKQQYERSELVLRNALDDKHLVFEEDQIDSKKTFKDEENAIIIIDNELNDLDKNSSDEVEREDIKLKVESLNSSILCKYCNLTFNSHIELTNHQKETKHPKRVRKAITCPICDKRLTSSTLVAHMRIHTNEKPYTCNVCYLDFSLKCNLRRHMMIHTGEKPHKCDVCGAGFIQSTSLTRHKKTHTGEQPYICADCGLKFAETSTYRNHVKKHMRENDRKQGINSEFQCGICGRNLSSKASLKTHVLTHGEKSYLCSDCGLGFTTKGGLISHSKVHTGERPYSCTVCDKSFSQMGTLKSHILIHTGERPHKCKLCSKTFTQRNHLSYHMRFHTGEKPYTCPYCNKSFTIGGSLKVHIRIHTGETPYICDICSKGFYESTGLKKHKITHNHHRTKYEKLILKMEDA